MTHMLRTRFTTRAITGCFALSSEHWGLSPGCIARWRAFSPVYGTPGSPCAWSHWSCSRLNQINVRVPAGGASGAASLVVTYLVRPSNAVTVSLQ